MKRILCFFGILFFGLMISACTRQEKANQLPSDQDAIETQKRIKAAVLDIETKAKNGDVYNQYLLGLIYHTGESVPLDYDKAHFWLMKAAQSGHAEAQRNLGYLYKYGHGVQQDHGQAVFWYRKAAEQGLADAQTDLGYSYNHGIGVPQNFKVAVEWYMKAAMQGDAWGQHNLARCYIDGHGVPQNYIYAYAWASLAAAQGHKNAEINRDIIARNFLNPRDLTAAQELATKLQYNIDNQKNDFLSKHTTEKASPSETKLKGSGTGFIVSKDGYILTCHHVIADATEIRIVLDKEVLSANLVVADEYNDLAILKISGFFPALAFSPERIAKMGQEVFTIGYPNPGFQGVNAKLTKGYISSLSGFQDDIRLYQISTPVQPGNSGGPLIDNNGNVIGVIVSMLDAKTVFQVSGSLPQNVNYAVKSTVALEMIKTIQDFNLFQIPSKTQDFYKVVEMSKKCVVMVLAYE